MNKNKVEYYLSRSIDALDEDECKIVKVEKNEKSGMIEKYIDKTFRSYISSFGAAVTMGSFKAAVAFFSTQSKAEQPRENLIRLLWFLTKNEWKSAQDICDEILKITDFDELNYLKDEFINASIAIKLAMNAYNLNIER